MWNIPVMWLWGRRVCRVNTLITLFVPSEIPSQWTFTWLPFAATLRKVLFILNWELVFDAKWEEISPKFDVRGMHFGNVLFGYTSQNLDSFHRKCDTLKNKITCNENPKEGSFYYAVNCIIWFREPEPTSSEIEREKERHGEEEPYKMKPKDSTIGNHREHKCK